MLRIKSQLLWDRALLSSVTVKSKRKLGRCGQTGSLTGGWQGLNACFGMGSSRLFRELSKSFLPQRPCYLYQILFSSWAAPSSSSLWMKFRSGITLEFRRFIAEGKLNNIVFRGIVILIMSRKHNPSLERGLRRLTRTIEQHQLVNSCMLMTSLKHPDESLTELLFRFNWARRHMLIMGKRFEDYLEFQVYRLIAQQALFQKGLAKIQNIVQNAFYKRKYLRKWQLINRKAKQPLSRLSIQKLYLSNKFDIMCIITSRNLYAGFAAIKFQSQQNLHRPSRRQALQRMITTINHYEIRLIYFHYANSPTQIETFDVKSLTEILFFNRLKQLSGVKETIDNNYWKQRAILNMIGVFQRKVIGGMRSGYDSIRKGAGVLIHKETIHNKGRFSVFLIRSLQKIIITKRLRQGFQSIHTSSEKTSEKKHQTIIRSIFQFHLSRLQTIALDFKKRLLQHPFEKIYSIAVKANTQIRDDQFEQTALSGIKTLGLIIRDRTLIDVQEPRRLNTVCVSALLYTLEAIKEKRLESSLEAIKAKATMAIEQIEQFEARAEICAKQVEVLMRGL